MAVENVGADSAALVFVYGSLKRHQPNHGQLLGCSWQGEAELKGLALFDLGPFPMAIPGEAEDCLKGEVYSVDPERLTQLDRFEGAPRLYERQRWSLADGRAVWVYVGRPHQVRHVQRIVSGCWRGRSTALVAALAAALPVALPVVLPAAVVQAADLRAECQAWSRAHGREQIDLANRIGREQLLTKTHRFAEASADDTESLYSWTDIQRLCRRQ